MKEFNSVIGGKKFTIYAEKELEPQALSLFSILKKIDQTTIVNGFSFQVAWATYFLEEMTQNCFLIKTNDYTSNPFVQKTDDLTLALWVQLEQGHLLRKLNIEEGEATLFNDKIILDKGVLEQGDIYIQRTSDVESGDSGWFIGYLEGERKEDLYAIYAYELLKKRPEFIQFLALPYDYMVILKNNNIEAVLNNKDENIWES
ncbi:immunity protein Imm33 domain-containing protein [Listeria aquatica]|uniref:immunity protein Imm33 domain-containing protein n=1 Tax=Listeria aquatica TaxID=1494960 RepID=UPI003F6EBC2F